MARIEKVTSSFALAHLLPSARQNLVSTAQASRYGNRLLAVPMPDEASRSDWLVEKAVELGATDIVPLITQRSATAKNMARCAVFSLIVHLCTLILLVNKMGEVEESCTIRYDTVFDSPCANTPSKYFAGRDNLFLRLSNACMSSLSMQVCIISHRAHNHKVTCNAAPHT